MRELPHLLEDVREEEDLRDAGEGEMTREEYESNLRKLGKETLIALILQARDSTEFMISNFKTEAK